MIPKIIHYCWFGKNPLPKSAVRCIKSWKKYLPDYEIKEWNEDNFDINIIPYTTEAYQAKKYAFVSDYARFWILYKYGGLYFDTDVEVIRNMDHIIANGPFMGFEQPSEDDKHGEAGDECYVNPGLGLGATPGMDLYKDMLDYYQNLHFHGADNLVLIETVVTHMTAVLTQKGLIANNKCQQVCGVWIYPWIVFCPKSYHTQKRYISEDTVSIHHYSDSWSGKLGRFKKSVYRLLGPKIIGFLRSIKYLFK